MIRQKKFLPAPPAHPEWRRCRFFQICAQVLPMLSNDALQFFPGTETPVSRHRKSVAQVRHASHSKRADRRRAKTFSGQQTGRVRFSARRDAIPSCGNLPDAAAGAARLIPVAECKHNPPGECSFSGGRFIEPPASAIYPLSQAQRQSGSDQRI